MNALCAMCPLGILGNAFCPDAEEVNRKLRREKYEVEQERDRLKEIMISEGLNTAGSIYVEGQQ